MSYRTTGKDLAYFEARVYHWVKVFSLGDWKVEVYIGRPMNDESNMAEADMWHNAHGAHIRLNSKFKYRPERAWLDKLALHEVCHVLLCDLTRLIKERMVSESATETAEHAVVRRLENALL